VPAKIRGLDGRKVVELAWKDEDTVRDVATSAAYLLGYHGTFSLKGPDGLPISRDTKMFEVDGAHGYWEDPDNATDAILDIMEVGSESR
jgi:hypothetical protein